MKRFGHLLLLFLACALVAPGCFSLDDVPPPSAGEERNEITCADGRDNDQDGRIDCEDTDCLMRGFCGEQIPLVPRFEPENTPETCTDGIDNDEDGQFDCGDRDCQAIMELCCSGETDNISCSNRIDDDGNGFADCTDFSCRNNQFVSVCQSEVQCMKFDDRGRLIPCTAQEQADAALRQCRDGFDNDGDRRTDCNDPDCACTEACRPGCAGLENTVERCSDGLDNDGNGFVDCADFGCSRSADPEVARLCETSGGGGEPENTAAACMDGVDNDGNGFTDCADRQCFDSRENPPIGAAVEYCAARQENTLERCTDGEDNDGNGYVDCNDNSCRQSPDPTIREVCEATFAACRDGRDNNNNGFTDCADFSCRFYECNRSVSCGDDGDCPSGQSCFRGACMLVRSPCFEGAFLGSSYVQMDGCPAENRNEPLRLEEQQAMVRAGCTDGVDNDGDGFVDCEDWDCNHNPLAVHGPESPLAGTPLCRGNDGRPLVCR